MPKQAPKQRRVKHPNYRRNLPLIADVNAFSALPLPQRLFLVRNQTKSQASTLASLPDASVVIQSLPDYEAYDPYPDWLAACKCLNGAARARLLVEGLGLFAAKAIPGEKRPEWTAACQQMLSEFNRLTSESGTAASLSLSDILRRAPEVTDYDAKSAIATHPERFGPSLGLLQTELLQGKLSGGLYEALNNSSFRKQEVTHGRIKLTEAATILFARAEGEDFLLRLVISRPYGDAISLALRDSPEVVREYIGEFLFVGLKDSRFCGQDPDLYAFAVRVNNKVAWLSDDSVVEIVLSFVAGRNLTNDHWISD